MKKSLFFLARARKKIIFKKVKQLIRPMNKKFTPSTSPEHIIVQEHERNGGEEHEGADEGVSSSGLVRQEARNHSAHHRTVLKIVREILGRFCVCTGGVL